VNTSNISLIPLRQASLCLDCETITTGHTTCHACGSGALLNVARALDRPRPDDPVRRGGRAAIQMAIPRVRKREAFRPGAANLAEPGRVRVQDNSALSCRRPLHEAHHQVPSALLSCFAMAKEGRGQKP
jgi:hypothetical protein